MSDLAIHSEGHDMMQPYSALNLSRFGVGWMFNLKVTACQGQRNSQGARNMAVFARCNAHKLAVVLGGIDVG